MGVVRTWRKRAGVMVGLPGSFCLRKVGRYALVSASPSFSTQRKKMKLMYTALFDAL